jgi:hypothetical protein
MTLYSDWRRSTTACICYIRPSPGRERIMGIVPEMDGVRTFRNKKGRWAGRKNFQKIPTSKVWFSNFVQTFITVLTGSAYSIQFQHKATTVPFITTTHGSRYTLGASISKQKEKEGTLFLSSQICLLRIKSINKYCELQNASDRHNRAYHNPAENEEETKQCISTTQQQYLSTIQHIKHKR